MAVTEENRQVRQKASERTSRNPGTVDGTASAEPQDRVDQVREILFGAQREEYEKRFSRLEELVVKSISDLRNDTTTKLNSLRGDIDKRLARLEELLAKNIGDLNSDTTKKFNVLKTDYDKKFSNIEESLDKLDKSLQEIRRDKVDKSAVTRLLDEVQKLHTVLK